MRLGPEDAHGNDDRRRAAALVASSRPRPPRSAACSIEKTGPEQGRRDALAGSSGSADVFTSDNDPDLVGDALPFAIKLYEIARWPRCPTTPACACAPAACTSCTPTPSSRRRPT
ncbi:MAG: TRAP transporter TatT component family protein [Sphingobacterium sp.]|nr:TRAP transporter TatT component family protein [Sphingobacterium sp.]